MFQGKQEGSLRPTFLPSSPSSTELSVVVYSRVSSSTKSATTIAVDTRRRRRGDQRRSFITDGQSVKGQSFDNQGATVSCSSPAAMRILRMPSASQSATYLSCSSWIAASLSASWFTRPVSCSSRPSAIRRSDAVAAASTSWKCIS
uniref:Uncharacterized protein n=1 Tax=Pristionchus pacificus TaxID=54126 RepID=A0A2A6BTL9_PRIPA|eukprot:PDM69207.1 hypothetical protein PRIPAC_47509 [Pristionchus pacificus]